MMTVTFPASFLALRVIPPFPTCPFTLLRLVLYPVGLRRRPTHGTLVGQGLPGRNHGIPLCVVEDVHDAGFRRNRVGGRRGKRGWLGCGCVGFVHYCRFHCLRGFGRVLFGCEICRYGRLFCSVLFLCRLLRGVFLFFVQWLCVCKFLYHPQ